jgi:predicted amidophosphoribosyltransferase
MVSFLTSCPECGSSIAKDSPCPNCHWTSGNSNQSSVNGDTIAQFAEREAMHRRNYGIFMLLSFATGFVGLLTALMWVLVIFRGSLLAFVGIGVFTVLTGILSCVLYAAKRMFPTELNCPGCEIRLDELGPVQPQCPNCGAQLKPHGELAHQ